MRCKFSLVSLFPSSCDSKDVEARAVHGKRYPISTTEGMLHLEKSLKGVEVDR